MKTAEFLEKLSKTPRTWRALARGAGLVGSIRNRDGHCPIESVAGGILGGYSQGKRIGLSRGLVFGIIGGADSTKPTLWRKRLLKACGLE